MWHLGTQEKGIRPMSVFPGNSASVFLPAALPKPHQPLPLPWAHFRLIGIEYLLRARRWVLDLSPKPVLVSPAGITAQKRNKMHHKGKKASGVWDPALSQFLGVCGDTGNPHLLIVFSSKKHICIRKGTCSSPSLFSVYFLIGGFVF